MSATARSTGDHASANLRAVLRLAGPAIAGQLLQTGVIYADRIMLGHAGAGGSGALAGLQVAGPIEWTLVSVGSAFSVGTLSLVGRAKGAGDHEAVRRHTTLALRFALLVGFVLTLLGALIVLPLLPRLFPNASSGPSGALTTGGSYLRAALLAAPFYCVGAAGIAALSGAGDTVTPLRIGVVVNVVHVALNWLLISGHLGFPALGVFGAGLSTAASYALEAALVVFAMARPGAAASLRRAKHATDDEAGAAAQRKSDFRALIDLSTPATLERVIYHAGYMTFVWMIARLGDDAMEANQALIAVEAISYTTVEGFAVASGALVAQQLGAGRSEEARRVGWLATGAATATLSSFALLFLVGRHQLPALITPRADIQLASAMAMFPMALAQPFMAIGVVLGQSLRGAGEVRKALAVSVVAGFGVRLASTALFTIGPPFGLALGVVGIWLGSTVDWIARTALLLLLWRRWSPRVDAVPRLDLEPAPDGPA